MDRLDQQQLTGGRVKLHEGVQHLVPLHSGTTEVVGVAYGRLSESCLLARLCDGIDSFFARQIFVSIEPTCT